MRRLDLAGALPAGSDITRGALSRSEIADLLTAADATEELHRFNEEFTPRFSARVQSHYEYRAGAVDSGHGYDLDWSGAQPLPNLSRIGVGARLAFESRRLGASIAVTDEGIEELQLVANLSPLSVWAGRRSNGYTVGQYGIVATPHHYDAVGIALDQPVHVKAIGALRFETQVGTIKNRLNFNNQENEIEPYYWLTRISMQPARSFILGINRGMMLGGEGNLPITFARVLRNAVGLYYTHNGENSFANQLVTVDLKVRTTRWPTKAYIEWGAEDAAGGWWHEPGILAGIEVATSRAAGTAVGLERTEFVRNQRSNSLWYQNAWFRGGWSDAGELMGHPLGGDGTEWRMFAQGHEARIAHWQVAAYERRRGPQNVFSPQRQGQSRGIAANFDVLLMKKATLNVRAEREGGKAGAWSRTEVRVGGAYAIR